MSYFDGIASYETMNEWRDAYKERTRNTIPSVVLVEMAKLMKRHELGFAEFAELIEASGSLAAAKEQLEGS